MAFCPFCSLYFLKSVVKSRSWSGSVLIFWGRARPLRRQTWVLPTVIAPLPCYEGLVCLHGERGHTALSDSLRKSLRTTAPRGSRVPWCLCRGNCRRCWVVLPWGSEMGQWLGEQQGSESRLCHSLAVWPWASYLAPLGLGFLFCTVGCFRRWGSEWLSCFGSSSFRVHLSLRVLWNTSL